MTDQDATANEQPRGDGPLTAAQRWATDAYRQLAERGREGLESILADDFVQESHRGVGFRFDRAGLLGTVRSMRELGMAVDGTPVAVAGERWLLTRRVYEHGSSHAELLAVSVWNEDGMLERLIEYDVDDRAAALATLAEVSGQPVVVLEP